MAEKTYTTNPLKGKETLKRLKGALRNAPVIGTVADVVDIGKEVLTGDYAGAAVATGTALAGITPIGRIASKGAKVVSKKLKKKPVIKEDVPTVEAAGLTDEDIAKFRKPESEGGRGTSSEFREALKGRNPELQELAKKVKEGKISVKEYRNRADEIRPIRLVSEVPKPATNKEIVSALNSKQRQNPLIGLNATIPEKDIVEVRLNIPAYTDYNVWIPTIRHNKKEKYKAAIKIQNVKFIQPDSSGSKKALNVATGVEKSPFAVMTGEYVDGSDDELFNMAKKVFDDDEWTQVGYDPIKRGFFYDRATGEAILEADEVIQVGHLVLAKNAKKADPDLFSFNQGGLTTDEQTQQAFNQGGTIMDKSKYRLLYFIPPELRKHVEFVKGLPRIIADTVTDPNTYTTLNQMLNPVEWVIAPVRNTRKFIDSGYKDVGALTNATIETLGLAAGPLAHKYASTLSPVASKGVSSGVKSLQELVMPLGASDDVAKKVSKRTGVNRRQFIAGTAALGAASGLKGVGDLFPTPKVVKATAKSPIFSTVVDLNKLRGQFKAKALRYDNILQTSKDIELNEEIGSLPSSMKKYDNDLFKFEEDALAKQEELMDVVNTIEAELMELTDNIVAEGIEGVSKLNEGELVNLRRTFTDKYNVYTRVGDFDHRISAPENLEAEKIVNKALENKGLMNLDDFRKSRLTVKNRKEAGELGITGDYEYDFYGNLTDDKLSVVDEFHSPLEKDFNQGGLTTDEQTQKVFNKGGTTMEQQMSLFEEGGMKDDGLDRDPVSGNEIPPGSLAREVRDDIPAQLSDGEYVVPADVVQYFGVKFFEDIRAEAKRGLAEMEATGRIGGEPVEVDMTMIAFGKAKEEEEKKKKAQGGVIHANDGVLTVDDDYFKQQAIAKANPTAGFGQVGQSLFGQTPTGNVPMPGTILITKTFYHPDGRIQAVQGTMRGSPPAFVPNQGFDQFTKAPWSETAPSQKQATTQKQERDDSKDPQFVSTETLANDPDFKGMGGVVLRDAKGNIISMTKQGYGAVLTSANRLGIPMQEYHNLPLLSKAKLIGQEIKSGFGREVDQDYIDEVVEGAKNNPENISILERFLNFITGGKSKKTEDTGTTSTSNKPIINQKKKKEDKDREDTFGSGTTKIDEPGYEKAKTFREAKDEGKTTQQAAREADVSDNVANELSGEQMKPADSSLGAGAQNKGGLATKTKPKRKTRKPRGKGLGIKK